MCVHLLLGLMLLGSKYSNNVCQSNKKTGFALVWHTNIDNILYEC